MVRRDATCRVTFGAVTKLCALVTSRHDVESESLASFNLQSSLSMSLDLLSSFSVSGTYLLNQVESEAPELHHFSNMLQSESSPSILSVSN